MIIQKATALSGSLAIPGDKSITHRAVMFGAISQGTTRITNYLNGADCLSTMHCFQSMGVPIEISEKEILVHGQGLWGLKPPKNTLDVGNSGTTTRLISGILSGQSFSSVLDGDPSMRRRPMKRIMDPLTQMGAKISSQSGDGLLPLYIQPSHLSPIHYHSPIASAQVKSCVLLAGLYCEGETLVTEPVLSRDHTERMLQSFGATVKKQGTTCSVLGAPTLHGGDICVPGDISSAAYPIAAALLVPGSQVLLKNVGTNPTRDGILTVLSRMGAKIERLNENTQGEPSADLLIRSSDLTGTVIEGDLIPSLIDELPMLAVLAAFAKGTTIIRDAAELKVKESNRIATVTEGLLSLGADVTPTEDGFIIRGGAPLHPGTVNSHMDHRIAMSFAVAGKAIDGGLTLLNEHCVDISYPTFYQDLLSLEKK